MLKDYDEFLNVGFVWYRRYGFHKCSVHVRFSHDGCHDEHMEEMIGEFEPLVPSVSSFVVVIVLVICEERIGTLTPLLPSVLSFFVVIVLVIREERIGALTPLLP